jgi:hypothetical protein
MTDDVQQNGTAPTAEQNSTDLTINDLNAMKVIIDIASSRGAFKPNEMVAVGQTYTKLETFLNTVSKQATQTPAGQQAAQAAANAVTGA